jgi:hypothetical protein
MPQRISIGDIAAYTDSFIDRHSRYPNDLPTAQGKVTPIYTASKAASSWRVIKK